MTQKEIYCMGRAEYLAEYEGYSLSAGYAIAEQEYNDNSINNRKDDIDELKR